MAEGLEQATNKREMMTFVLPNVGEVKMYINPQNMVVSETKDIKPRRTKGGFVIQYWGEELATMRLSGTTGSSGISGINVLRRVYRSEVSEFKDIAEQLKSSSSIVDAVTSTFSSASNLGIGSVKTANTLLDTIGNKPANKATLATLAAGIKIKFQGVTYTGYFTSFEVTENADQQGLFEYSMAFTILARKGTRTNFMPWHRQATIGIDGVGNFTKAGNAPLSFDGEEPVE